jgi:asparagine synthase (glutamine-hydrolysing)
MCGIAGFVDRTDPAPSESLQRMLERIVHRGPDGMGVHLEETRGLAAGMRRLSIIDLEGGTQPIWNEDHSVGVLFNGEIYNYVELRRELEAAGHVFRTNSDTEVLVHLYEASGTRMFDRLRGMFAFCIHDRARNSLLIARDHFGQKPLYYTSGGGRFAFASELKSILALNWVDRALDPEALLDYATWLSLPPPRTHFREIWKLPAGCFLEVKLDDEAVEPAVTRYWRYELGAGADLRDPASAIEELDRTLRESVRVHLRADVPVGVLLSSGLDSRTVVAYAQELQNETVQTFTVGFGSEDSELAGAAETAREIRSRHHQLELTAGDLSSSIGRIASLLDEPVGDPACFAVLKVCELARQHVKVLLSGEGSDELLAGYEGRYAGMLETLQRTERFRRFGAVLPEGMWHSHSRWQRLFARAHSTPASEIALLRIEGFPGDARHPRGLTVEQLRRVQQRAKELGNTVFRAQRDRLSELLTFDLDWQLAESLLQKADKMSMGASIELRTPLLDREVAALALRIPSAMKLPPGGPGKLILRQTLARKLNEPLTRPKKGFPVPLADWFRGPLRHEVESTLFASDSAIGVQFDPILLRGAWDDFLANRWDGARPFYALWLYERWHRRLLR